MTINVSSPSFPPFITAQFQREWFKSTNGYGGDIFNQTSWDYNEKTKENKPVGQRVHITTLEDFTDYLKRMQQLNFHCWLTVFPCNAYDTPAVIDKLYFDFDSKTNIEAAWNEANHFQEKLKHNFQAESLLVYSGSKGFNLYVWLKIPFFESVKNLKATYDRIQRTLLLGTNYKTLDQNPIGDIKRVSRVPYTIHPKSRSLCVPVNSNWQPLALFSLDFYRQNGLSAQFIEFCIKKQRQQEEQQRKDEEKQKQYLKRYPPRIHSRKIRPCIEAALHQNLTGSTGHKTRLAIAAEHLNNDFTVKETSQLFSCQEDYKATISLDICRDLKERGFKPFKCSTLQGLGLCLPDCTRKKFTPK